jgi:hypothetical protein
MKVRCLKTAETICLQSYNQNFFLKSTITVFKHNPSHILFPCTQVQICLSKSVFSTAENTKLIMVTITKRGYFPVRLWCAMRLLKHFTGRVGGNRIPEGNCDILKERDKTRNYSPEPRVKKLFLDKIFGYKQKPPQLATNLRGLRVTQGHGCRSWRRAASWNRQDQIFQEIKALCLMLTPRFIK